LNKHGQKGDALDTLEFSVENQVGWIRLARPKRHNPLDPALRSDLRHVLDLIRNDPAVRVVVLTGADGAFCSGGDLQDLRANADAGAAYWQQRIKNGLRVIDDLIHVNRPLIAMVDGPAFGAGFALALTADMVVTSPRARFSMAHLKLGLVPDLGALYLLPRVVGRQRAKELIFSTREISAEEARQLGVVMEVCDSDKLEGRVRQIAESMTHASPVALALTKAALNISLDSDQQGMFALEAAAQAAAFAAPEPKQAIDALLGRQPPPYRWPTQGMA
jgi:2-(1,2-epoxy-1,2-dihydrophenyl)acetyl-CoA isomerase